MKLTKEKEVAILQAYNTFWDANLSADMETFGSYLVDDFSIFGSANGEVFLSKQEAVKFYTATADQMRGKAQLRNRSINVQSLDNSSVIIREESDLYVLIGTEWTFYGHARISCILKLTDGGWKAVHQHASFPDHRTEEGQQLAAEKIEKENLELREAVKRRTIELEHKTRELVIESSLEKVRSRSLAMHNTSELQEVIHTVHKELLNLNLSIAGGSFIAINDEVETELRCWGSGGTADTSTEVHLPPYDKPFLSNLIHGIKNGPGFFIEEYTQQEKKEFFTFLFKHEPWSKLDSDQKKEILSSPCGYTRSCCVSQHTSIFIINHFGEKFSEADNDILKRFAKVFEQAYTRFLDLQKAEAQAREARIETALERVRSRSMAMHKSEELADLSLELVKQVQALGVATWFCAFNIYDDDPKGSLEWGSNGEGAFPRYRTPREGIFLRYYEAGQKGETLLIHEIDKDECPAHYEYLCSLPGVGDQLLKMKAAGIPFPVSQLDHVAFFKYGYIIFITYEPAPESHDIFKRFAKVFEQTYIRFLDLQNAEEQAREAKIEAALERVRSRAMGMRSSEELNELIGTVFTELTKLDFVLARCLIMIYDPATNNCRWWMANSEDPDHPMNFLIQAHDHEPNLVYIEGWKARKVKSTYELKGAVKKKWDDFLFSETELKRLPDFVIAGMKQPEHVFLNVSFNTFGNLTLATLEPLPDEHFEIMLRFAKVFDLTYTRFNDLKQAEAQAREAQIEAALERVRAKTMSMQHSNELIDAATVLFQQIEMLGAPSWNCSFNIWTEDKKQAIAWNATKDGFGRPFHTPSSEDVFLDFYVAAQAGEELYVKEIGGKELELHYAYLATLPGVGVTLAELKAAGITLPTHQVFNIAYFSHGYLMFITYESVSQLWVTFKRFAKVFEQTYTRFLDLQKAEAQAKEAKIEAALEKVRSRSLAMHKSDEIGEVVWVVVDKMKELNIAVQGISLVTFIPNSKDVLHWHANAEHVGAATTMVLPYFDDVILNDCYQAKEDGMELLVKVYSKEEKNRYFNYAVEHSDFRSIPEELKQWVREQPYLVFSYAIQNHSGIFLEDYTGKLFSKEENDILIRFSRVFEQSYVRFLDLQKAEAQALRAEQDLIEIKAARKKAEETLNELQLTQKQLIQSEKMASLGELTAGIAHEIQNPLNFVNNFSDVSTELVAEMNLAIEKGNNEEAKQLAQDLKQNLEKINHHGKRAGDIVKGMLQHSRTSSGQKEFTDINVLADEYLRLAYHGLKAKDKSFNAKFETNLDASLPKINVVPQDIGRVILNLINNAFYVVSERQKSAESNYKPTVIISTKFMSDRIEIRVNDNGNGIPEQIKDKIFQPFFTTKPTGQGTGLGLSLSYDIIKAHGGTLRVESEAGVGSQFTIQLILESK